MGCMSLLGLYWAYNMCALYMFLVVEVLLPRKFLNEYVGCTKSLSWAAISRRKVV